MRVLTIERLGIGGLPDSVGLDAGGCYAVVVSGAGAARRLADLLTGLAELPAGAVVRGESVRLVPAEGGLLPHLTVQQNLVRAHRAVRRGVPRARAVEACVDCANQCGLGDVLQRYPYEIAPGRRRLAGVARALCAEASVIVLEDAPGLMTWDVLPVRNPRLLHAALLLVTTDRERIGSFQELGVA